MSVVDLSRRITTDPIEYERYSKSSASLILVQGPIYLDDGPASLELSIGDAWFDNNNHYYAIPDGGILLRPGMSIVVETEQTIGVPLNVYGIVTGKGKFIFQGLFISSGKVDPSFYDRLRIGLFNGGNKSVVLRRGDPFCYVTFFNMETHSTMSRSRGDIAPRKNIPREPLYKQIKNFLRINWRWLIGVIIAIISLILSLLKG